MKDQIKKIEHKVYALLVENPKYRDSDRKLQARIWYDEVIAKGCPADVATCFLNYLINSTLSNPESIRRIRQKIQELHPELRGSNYRDRHREQKVMRTYMSNH